MMVGCGVALVMSVLFSSSYGLKCLSESCEPAGEGLTKNCRQQSENCTAGFDDKSCYTKYYLSNTKPLNGCLLTKHFDEKKLSANECKPSSKRKSELYCLCSKDDCNTLKYGMNEYEKWVNEIKKNGDKKGETGLALLGSFLSGPLLLAALFLLPLF